MPALTMERKRAMAPFATEPARRPPKDAVDSDDEANEGHSSGSLFPPLEIYEEGEAEHGQGNSQVQSQLVQEEAESQRQLREKQQQQQQQSQREDGELQSPDNLWNLMSERERRGESDDDDQENDDNNNNNNNRNNKMEGAQVAHVHDRPQTPPRKRQRKAVAPNARPTAATNRSRRGRGVMSVANVLEQVTAAIDRAQPERRPLQKKRQLDEEGGAVEGAAAQQQDPSKKQRRETEQQPAAGQHEKEGDTEERLQQQQQEHAERGEGDVQEVRVDQASGTAQATSGRSSRRLQGLQPSAEPEAMTAAADAEFDASGGQPVTQRTAETIQETPQETGDSGEAQTHSQGEFPGGGTADNNYENDDDNAHDNNNNIDTQVAPQMSTSQDPTAMPVTELITSQLLSGLIDLMGMSGWTGKVMWKMGLSWQHTDPGRFGPEPFTAQAKNLLRQLAGLNDAYVHVPRPIARPSTTTEALDLRVQRQYLHNHHSEHGELLSMIDASINRICHNALQPLTIYASDATPETVRFRWLLAEDLVAFVIPKAVEVLETVYALGGSMPGGELGESTLYVPGDWVHMIHATLYLARRVVGWITRLENAVAWELGYRADRRITGVTFTYQYLDDADEEAGQRLQNSALPRPESIAAVRRNRCLLKPLLNGIEDELNQAWLALEHAQTAHDVGGRPGTQEGHEVGEVREDANREAGGVGHQDENDSDGEWMPVAVAASQTVARTQPQDISGVDDESFAFEPANGRAGESLEIGLTQPPAASLAQGIRDGEVVRDGDGDDDKDDDNGDKDDSPVMTTAITTAVVAQPSSPPPVASVEQVTQDMLVVERNGEADDEDGLVVNTLQVAGPAEAEVPVEIPVEVPANAPATPAADIPTPAPTPTPTPTREGTATASPGSRPYADAELKQILARLRALKGTAQLDVARLAADLNRDVFDVANRAEGIKSVVRAKLLRDKKPVPHWAQAGFTIR